MDASQVVIHFIGLVLFTTQVPHDHGLHAILPAIHAVPRPDTPHSPLVHQMHLEPARAAEPNPGTAPAAAPAGLPANIEPHVALLIFHQDMVANDSQWKTSTIVSRFPQAASLASYKYVELTGEHITFVVDAPSNARAKIPPNMPRLSCDTPGRLTSGYQWPYTKAAAVVDIHEGKLSVCEARKVTMGRVDTRLVLNTTGTLTIVAAKSGVVKTLVLRTANNPTIYLANVPPPPDKKTRAATHGGAHHLAYYKMIGKDPTNCSGPPRVNAPVPGCDRSPVLTIIGAPPFSLNLAGLLRFIQGEPVVLSIPSLNAECSNTQWP